MRGRENNPRKATWVKQSDLSKLWRVLNNITIHGIKGTALTNENGVTISIKGDAVANSQLGYADVGGLSCSASKIVSAPVNVANGSTAATASITVLTPVGGFAFPSDTEIGVWKQSGAWTGEWPFNMTGYNSAATSQVYGHKAGAHQYIDLEEFSCPE